jgi:hypothetical protein
MENTSQSKMQSEAHRERLRNWGYRDAANHTGDPQGLKTCLGAVYKEYKDGTKSRELEIKKRLEDLKAENEKLRSEIKPKEDLIKNLQIELMDIEQHPDKAKEKAKMESEFSSLGFSIGSILLVLLSVYLFIFYSSAIHSAFIKNLGEVLQSTALTEDVSILFNTIFDPQALADARKSGAAALTMTILSPTLFIAMGLLLHVMSTKKKYQSYRFVRIGALLSFVFFADVVIAYKITQGIYDAKFLAGLVEETWKFSMIWQDVNFYLVLIAGFAGYIIWGVLLDYVTEEFKALRYLQAYKKKLHHQIDTLMTEIKKCADTILSNESEIKHHSNLIDAKIVDVEELKSTIDTYVSGWTEFVDGLYQGPDEHKDDPIIEQINKEKEIFIRDILAGLVPTDKITTKFV